MPLRFNEAQMKFANLREGFLKRRKPVRIVACKARRTGVSTVVESYLYHDTTNHEDTNSLIVANQGRPSENVLKMCTTFWRQTPETIAGLPFRPRLPDAYRNNPPKDRLEFPDMNSGIFIASARSIDQYLGHAFHNIHATEVAYYKDGQDLFRALGSTLVRDPHSMCVLESTPNGKSGIGQFFYEQCMTARENMALENWEDEAYRLLFIPWHEMRLSFRLGFDDDDKRRSFAKSLTADELDLVRRFKVDLEQLLWRRATLRRPEFNNDPEVFDQEFPTDLATAFLSSGSMVFGRKAIKRLISRTRDPIWQGDIFWGSSDEDCKRNAHDAVRQPQIYTRAEAVARDRAPHTNERVYNPLRIFRYPKKGERIFITGDVGGGDPDSRSGDYSTLVVGVLNEQSAFARDEVIMTWRGRLNPLLFGELASALSWYIAARVGDEVTMPELVLEWNGPGVSCNTWVDRQNLYPNTYRYIQPSTHGQPKTKHIGWESNAKTKPMMVNYTQRHIEQDLVDIPDEQFVEELSSYRQLDDYGDSSSYGGESGTHDDCVTALEIFIVRARQESGTGQPVPIINIEDNDLRDEPGDIAFDRFREREAELEWSDGEDEDEETAFYTGMRA